MPTPLYELPTRGAGTLVSAPSLADEVETWLRTQPRPALDVWWVSAGERTVVRDASHLAALVAALDGAGSFGVLETPAVRWAQTMRMPGGFVVEVNGTMGPDCFARRVQADPTPGRGDGTGGHRDDLFTEAVEVSRYMWAWIHGRALERYELAQLDEDGSC